MSDNGKHLNDNGKHLSDEGKQLSDEGNSPSQKRKRKSVKVEDAPPVPILVVVSEDKAEDSEQDSEKNLETVLEKNSAPSASSDITSFGNVTINGGVIGAVALPLYSEVKNIEVDVESYIAKRQSTKPFNVLDFVDDRNAHDLLATAKSEHKENALKKVLVERELPRVNRDLSIFLSIIAMAAVYSFSSAPGGHILILSAMIFLWFTWVGAIGRLMTVSSIVFEERSLRAIGPMTTALALPFCSISAISLVVLSRLLGTYQSPLLLALLMMASVAMFVHQVIWPLKLAVVAKSELDAHYGTPQSKSIVYLAPILMYAPFVGMFVGIMMAALLNSSIGSVVFYASLLGMYSGFRYLSKLVKTTFEATGGAKREALITSKKEEGLQIGYRPASAWERWVRQRMQHRGGKKLVYLLVMMMVVVGLNVPQMALDAIVSLSGNGLGLGAAAGAGMADKMNAYNQTLLALNFLQFFILSLAAGAFAAYVAKPTNIRLTQNGLQVLWRHGWLKHDDKPISWESLRRISVELPRGKTEASDQELILQTSDGRTLNLKLSAISSVDDRERLLKSIEAWAPSVERDARVLQVLEPPADHSYTELWMQALTAPPKRERFKPLVEGAALNDGQFKIVDQLGVGGQGTAYLAIDVISNERVVLKEFILPVYVTVGVRRQALERFENEARILKHLDHDQIVKLVDFFVEDHRSYLVLEHIDGQSLRQIVESKGAMSEKRVMELSEQMCAILSYLHGLIPPVVHRDFTPDNLILRADGVLKLVDFNVAQQSESTTTGTVVGKHSYLPPEQFRGEPTPQSDIYAMGATLHFLLTGENPEPISVSRPATVCDTVSEGMDLLVAKATAMTPETRFRTAADVQIELDGLQGKIPLLTQEPDQEPDPEPDEPVERTKLSRL